MVLLIHNNFDASGHCGIEVRVFLVILICLYLQIFIMFLREVRALRSRRSCSSYGRFYYGLGTLHRGQYKKLSGLWNPQSLEALSFVQLLCAATLELHVFLFGLLMA